MVAVAKAVRKARKDALIIAGGYFASLNTTQLLQLCPEIDIIVRGEGEAVASDLLGRIDRAEHWCEAPGIAFLAGHKPVLNPVPPLIADLDSIPFPARDALKQAKIKRSAGIASSRGCYYSCSFCSVRTFYGLSGKHTPRFRSPENILDEIESVIAETGIKRFCFVDDDFIGPGKKMRERITLFAQAIKDRKVNFTFSAEFRADEVDADIVAMLKDIGLVEIFLGVESGVQSQLERFNKHVTVEQNKKAIGIVRDSGVKYRCGFIMFDPYVTVPEIQENMQFIHEMGLDADAKASSIPLLTKMAIFRGAAMELKLREDGLIKEHGLDIDYIVKDPQLRMMMKVTHISGIVGAMTTKVKRLF
jgi:radical SAM superfamily enzyme YgiQ (UPF0313 family)